MADNETNQDEFVKILRDEPVEDGKLGFEVYADVLTNIILGSDTPFTIGIFGDWGTGKTTLMRMVEKQLGPHCPHPKREVKDPKVIPVWFDAWRYERETDLILPLLTRIVDKSSECMPQHFGEELRNTLKSLAVGIVGGLKLKAPFLEWDVDKSMQWVDSLVNVLPGSSQYEQAYKTLQDTIATFAKAGDTGYENKFVVFVDDLDRCLPEPALAVLEAVKVFLGFPGMVYVLGLNRTIIEKCVQIKYCAKGESLEEHPYGPDLGDKYIKKIVQVPFSIPPGTKHEMDELVEGLISQEHLPEELLQPIEDLMPDVPKDYDRAYIYRYFENLELPFPQLENVCDIASAYLEQKPREMKRLVNAYVVSSKVTRAQMAQDPESQYNPAITMSLLVLRFLDEDTFNRIAGEYTDQVRAALRSEAARTLGIGRDGQDDAGDNAEAQHQGEGSSRSDDGHVEGPGRDGEPGGTHGSGMPVNVARLLLQTRLLEVAAEEIRPYARATTVTVTPEIRESGHGALTREEALELLRAGMISQFNRWRRGTDYPPLDLTGTHLPGANLRGADLLGANLTGADLREADLSRADLSRVNLSGADLSGAVLREAYLHRANLHRANLHRADLRAAHLTGTDLGGADLSGACLIGAVLSGAVLSEADLSGALLIDASLSRADLTEADLTGADLTEADLTRADLRRADLTGADATGADLTGADLEGATID